MTISGLGRKQGTAGILATCRRPYRQGITSVECALLLAVIVISAVVCFQSLGQVTDSSARVASASIDYAGGTTEVQTCATSDDSDDSATDASGDGGYDTSRRHGWWVAFRRWLRAYWSR